MTILTVKFDIMNDKTLSMRIAYVSKITKPNQNCMPKSPLDMVCSVILLAICEPTAKDASQKGVTTSLIVKN